MKEDHGIHVSLDYTVHILYVNVNDHLNNKKKLPVYRYVWLIGSPRICGRRFSFGRAYFQGTC